MKKKNFFMRNKTFTVFGVLAILIILTAVFAPVVTGGVNPAEGDLSTAIQPPGPGHVFGTDKLGRDIFTRVIYGARVSLTASFSVVILIFVIGTVLGILAGYFGGAVDAVIMRIADMRGGRHGIEDALHTAALYAAQCAAYVGDHGGGGYRQHDAGTGVPVFPGIRREGSGRGMGTYAE